MPAQREGETTLSFCAKIHFSCGLFIETFKGEPNGREVHVDVKHHVYFREVRVGMKTVENVLIFDFCFCFVLSIII